MTPVKCQRCDGCGKIANTEEGEPWTAWAELPFPASVAVRMGLVKPVTCPACGGDGVFDDGPDDGDEAKGEAG